MGEALLIFLSVLAAFYFDNLREERNQKRTYLRYLHDFKADLLSNQGKFGFELANDFDPNTNRGYFNHRIQVLTEFDSLLRLPASQSQEILIGMINDQEVIGLTPWIFTSPQYEKLSSQYYSFIKTDSLKGMLEVHYRNNISRQNYKHAINGHVSNFQQIEDQLNLDYPADRTNRLVLYGNESKNKIRRIRNTYEGLRNFTWLTKNNDSTLLLQVNKELAAWGEGNAGGKR